MEVLYNTEATKCAVQTNQQVLGYQCLSSQHNRVIVNHLSL